MKYLLGLAMLDGHVFAVGGWEGSSRLDSVERYDPETNTWSPVASLKMAVTSPAVVAHEGKVKVAFYQKILMHTCHILKHMNPIIFLNLKFCDFYGCPNLPKGVFLPLQASELIGDYILGQLLSSQG